MGVAPSAFSPRLPLRQGFLPPVERKDPMRVGFLICALCKDDCRFES
jgi:hypothetical protein